MNKVSIEDCLKIINNRFALVILISSRSRQLMKGSKPLVDEKSKNEQIIALSEIVAKKVSFNEKYNELVKPFGFLKN